MGGDYVYWFCFLSISYLVLFYAFELVLIQLWWIPRKTEKYFMKQGIKGPAYHFLLGNLKEILAFTRSASSQAMSLNHNILPRVFPFYHSWKKLYGSTYVIWFGPTARLTIDDPNLIKDIFILKSESFEKVETPPAIRNVEGGGLLTLEGEKWAHHRKIMTPQFYMENLKLMIPTMEKSMTEMLNQWSEMSNGVGEVEVDASKCFESLSEEVITRTVFGSNSYEDGKLIFEMQAQQMDNITEAYYKILIPGYRFLPTKNNRISWKLDKQIRKSSIKLIDERKKNSSEVVSDEAKDILELMIKASTKNHNSTNIITTDDIVEECKTFFFTGKYTTSTLLTWTTILLSMHPEWQEKAREEVLSVCKAHNTLTKDDMAKLKLLGMILNETLRLYPPAVATIRRAKVDLRLGNLSIPSGTELLINMLAVHHDETLWGSDAKEFNPGRFDKGIADSAQHPTAFMAFGLGSRRCIGQNLAILQAKITMAMILQRFSFSLSPNYKHAPNILILLNPQYGAPVIFKRL